MTNMLPLTIHPENRRDLEIATIARDVPTPAYIYDLTALRTRVHELRQALGGFPSQLFFATMANDHPRVLQELASQGIGACVNSLNHLDLALAAGFPEQKIQFTSTGLPHAVFERLRRSSITVNLDSAAQVEGWRAVGGESAGVRINASSLGLGRPFDRIGIHASELQNICRQAAKIGVSVVGLHIYVGTNIQQPQEIIPTLDAFFRVAEHVHDLRYLNIGGGIGVNYQRTGPDFDIGAYGASLAQLHSRLSEKLGREINVVVEPGRGLVAGCGTFLTRITDQKTLAGIRYIGVDASIAVFPRPFHHPDVPHRIRGLNYHRTGDSSRAVVAGCTTFSRDILGEAVIPVDTGVGDLLIVDDAGAYSQSMMSRFLGQRDPETLFLD
ncbi:MAG: hypothetical protein AB7H70_09915 [Rhodospirillaceae bacterium]